MDKKIKTCGLILFIKSIIHLILTIIGFSGGLLLAIFGKIAMNKNANTGDAFSDSVANCSTSFLGAIGIVFGIIAIVVSIILGTFAILYFVHSRKLLYTRPIPKRSYTILKVLEILWIIISIIGIVICMFNLKDTYVLMIVLFLVGVQSLITVIQLSKLKISYETNS